MTIPSSVQLLPPGPRARRAKPWSAHELRSASDPAWTSCGLFVSLCNLPSKKPFSADVVVPGVGRGMPWSPIPGSITTSSSRRRTPTPSGSPTAESQPSELPRQSCNSRRTTQVETLTVATPEILKCDHLAQSFNSFRDDGSVVGV
jgi:hypothetical protein